jgi:hypothetical protein
MFAILMRLLQETMLLYPDNQQINKKLHILHIKLIKNNIKIKVGI